MAVHILVNLSYIMLNCILVRKKGKGHALTSYAHSNNIITNGNERVNVAIHICVAVHILNILAGKL